MISIFEFPPGQHFGEAEENEGGEVVSSAAAVEADSEAATPAVEVGRGHEVIMGSRFHDSKISI